MDRLRFELPEFTRTLWVSDRAREVWEPRLTRIRDAWMAIEWLAVAAGVRKCCVTFATPEDFILRGVEWAKLGLNSLPVALHSVQHYSYAGRAAAVEPGKPFVFRFVLGAPRDVASFHEAFQAGDEKQIAAFLGYPPCCYEFYRRVWVEEGLCDTTWPMAVATKAPAEGGRTIEVEGPPESNILWRWMGVRAVSHLPCSFHCPATVALAERLLDVGRRAGFAAEMDWLLEVLRWPVEWSALHGIAEVKTPILKVSTKTDATGRKYVVRRRGDSYPAEGVQGLHFPYQAPGRLHLTDSRGFKQGLLNPLPLVDAPATGCGSENGVALVRSYASDNGFGTVQGMDEAHEPIVNLAAAALSGTGGNVLDLGCGNGALLKKICAANARVVPYGVELGPERVAHARQLLPDFAANFFAGSMFEDDRVWADDRRYALALVMPGRFLEVEPAEGERLKSFLKKRCDRILVYAYGDWLTRYQGLAGLARQAGLRLEGADADGKVGFATLA